MAAMVAGYAAGSLPFRGFQSLGAFIGVIIGGLAWMSWRGHLRRDWLEVAGAGSFALPFAWIFVRMGCVVERAHAGALSDSWLALPYPDGLSRWDLALLEMLWAVTLAALFVYWRGRESPAFFAAVMPGTLGLFRLAVAPLQVGPVAYWGPALLFAWSVFVAWKEWRQQVRHSC